MSRIHLKDVAVLRGDPLFSNLSLTIGPGDRLGLVAANGRGKSTLLRCLAGEDEVSSGEIARARGLRIGHLAQEIPAGLTALTVPELVLAALPPEQADMESWRVDVVLDDLAFPEPLRALPLGRLSGGWQRMAMLARVWVAEPDMLLLDEPTNHLDLARIGWLQGWLAALPRDFAVVIASHDRALLDAITNRTLFLRAERGVVFALPYSRAKAALAATDAAEDRRFHNDMKQVQQLRRQAAKLKNTGINSGSDLLITKTKQLKDRAEKLEDAARPAHQEVSAGAIRLSNSGSHAKALITLDDAAITTPDGRLLFMTGQKWIGRGERVAVLGRNEQGKTRLLQVIADAIGGGNPAIRVAASVSAAYCDQGLSQLDQHRSPMAAITSRFDVGDQPARSLLAGAGVRIEL